MFAIVGKGKETIHSGHFMVSQFEADEQDDEYELAVPVPEEGNDTKNREVSVQTIVKRTFPQQQLTIDTSLSKLFQCMTIAYRQKLTSPKWNRFRGIRLRWKDKIRLNNVIWRCWHMQFIKKINTLICQFASPLDVDTHNKPEAIVLEGKYWKRKLAAVTAEYKKWRMYYRNNVLEHNRDTMDTLSDLDALNWHSHSNDMHMMVDEDYLGLMSDTLFSTITNQPFVFPDSREIAKAGLADFIQPSLGPLQPNLDDYMDTFEPLQEFISSKLPSVPEECGGDMNYKQENLNWCYTDLSLLPESTNTQMNRLVTSPDIIQEYGPVQIEKQETNADNAQIHDYDTQMIMPLEYNISSQQTQNQIYSPSSVVYPTGSMSAAEKSLKITHNRNIFDAYSTPRGTPVQSIATQSNLQLQSGSDGYKFQMPTTPNIKFTSSQGAAKMNAPSGNQRKDLSLDSDHGQKEVRSEGRTRNTHRSNRQRSISVSREPVKRPPLLSAISDPQLVTPANSVLLTQLLTGSSQTNRFNQNQPSTSAVTDPQQNIRLGIKEEGAMALVMNTQLNPTPSTSSDPLLLPTSNSNSPTSSHGIGSCPTSPQDNLGSPGRDPKDQRRVGHIHAEQKRRYNIKNGFDMIHSLIPHLNQNPNAKLSKAAMLQKGAEYIRQLQLERKQLKEEMDSLRQQIETLNTSISNCQSMLPPTGAPVSRKRDDKMQEMFDDYVKRKTMEDWRFWIFSLLFKPLLVSFNNFVSTASLNDLYRTTLQWVEQHCTLHDLRPIVLNSLRYLCTRTEILSAPERLPEEARQAVQTSSFQPNQR